MLKAALANQLKSAILQSSPAFLKSAWDNEGLVILFPEKNYSAGICIRHATEFDTVVGIDGQVAVEFRTDRANADISELEAILCGRTWEREPDATLAMGTLDVSYSLMFRKCIEIQTDTVWVHSLMGAISAYLLRKN